MKSNEKKERRLFRGKDMGRRGKGDSILKPV